MTHNEFRDFVSKSLANGDLTSSQFKTILKKWGYDSVNGIPAWRLEQFKKKLKALYEDEEKDEYPKKSAKKSDFIFDDEEEDCQSEDLDLQIDKYEKVMSNFTSTIYRSGNGEGDQLAYVIPAGFIGSVPTFHVVESDLCGNVKLVKFRSQQQLKIDYGIEIG